MKQIRFALAALALAFTASAHALADTCIIYQGQVICGPVVPEISASASIGGVVLLMGAILMIRGRQRRLS